MTKVPSLHYPEVVAAFRRAGWVEIAVHLDDDRPSQPGARHDEVIALRARLNATCEFADVTELLPRDVFQAIALRRAAPS